MATVFWKNSNLVFVPTTVDLGKVLNDLRANTASKQLSVLVLLDLCAAFDTVDHYVLLDRLERWVGLSDPVLSG